MTSLDSERRRVRGLIQRAGVAMLTIIDEHAAPISRPMSSIPGERSLHLFPDA